MCFFPVNFWEDCVKISSYKINHSINVTCCFNVFWTYIQLHACICWLFYLLDLSLFPTVNASLIVTDYVFAIKPILCFTETAVLQFFWFSFASHFPINCIFHCCVSVKIVFYRNQWWNTGLLSVCCCCFGSCYILRSEHCCLGPMSLTSSYLLKPTLLSIQYTICMAK